MKKQGPKGKLSVLLRWIFWVVLVQLILLNISAALYAYKFTHVYDDPELRTQTSHGNLFSKTWRLFSGPRQPRSLITEYPSFLFDTVELKTASGIAIDAWYSQPDSNSRGTVLLFHGIQSNKGMLLHEASAFRAMGFSVLLTDFRAHGNSGSRVTTLGVREAEEVVLAYNYIRSRGEKNIFLWGSSMGAVVVARAVWKYNLQPTGVLLEMPFGSLQEHLQARARNLGFQGLPEKPFGFFVSLWIGWEKGFNGLQHKSARYASALQCPVLYQYGMLDKYVRRAETERVFAAIPSTRKKLVGFPAAGHESLQQNDPQLWDREVKAFLDSCLVPR